ncbi:MAG: hypothetical protein V3V14_08970 [Saprospiraceae bacterium]
MKNKITLEIIWWFITAIIVVLFLIPIYSNIGKDYPFYFSNILMIIIFVTFSRYIFQLKHTWLARNKWVKAVLIFVMIPIFFWVTDSIYNFQNHVEKDGFATMMIHMNPDEAMNLSKYIRYQYIFFGTSTWIVLILFPIRLLISIWREINTDKV